jgi:hypothetical protein
MECYKVDVGRQVMKFLRFLLFLFSLLLLYLSSKGQTREEKVLYAESLLANKKKAMILNYFQLTEAEKSSFWPLYNRYNRHIHDYELEYFYLQNRYDKGLEKLSVSDLHDLSERFIQNDLELARLRKQYYRRFRKALSPLKATEFMQLDQTFRTLVRLELQKDPAPFEILVDNTFSRRDK